MTRQELIKLVTRIIEVDGTEKELDELLDILQNNHFHQNLPTVESPVLLKKGRDIFLKGSDTVEKDHSSLEVGKLYFSAFFY